MVYQRDNQGEGSSRLAQCQPGVQAVFIDTFISYSKKLVSMDFWQRVVVGVLVGPLILVIISLLLLVVSDTLKTLKTRWKNKAPRVNANINIEPTEETQQDVIAYIEELKKGS